VIRRSKLLGFAITVACLVLAFYRIDLNALYGALAAASYWVVLPAALCTLLGYLSRTVRWRVILADAAACPLGTLFGVLMIGFATNNLLPARLGEFARAYLLRRRSGVRKTFLLASIFVERLFDGLVLVAVLSGLSLVADLPGWSREVELLAGAIFLSVGLGALALLTLGERVPSLLQAVTRPLPARLSVWTSGAAGAFLAGLSTIQRPSVLLKTAALSVVVWSLEWASYFTLSGGFELGLSDGQRAIACALLLAVVNLGIMLPSSPGYVGTFQVFAVAALTSFGVARETALAFAIVAHLSQYILVTAIGAAFFGREHISLRRLAGESADGGDRDAERVPTGATS
jgi:glycosyltransferase 2 family protein